MQRWADRYWNFSRMDTRDRNPIRVATCDQCGEYSLWLNDSMLYPDCGIAPQPNTDLPEDVKSIYLEAAGISRKSPRGAAALLRLGIQVLCKELGEKGENINADIKSLVKKGLPQRVQQALDVVRVTGNDAVHPGQIDVDDPKVVGTLFDLVNVIAEYMLSMPKRVSEAFSSLPAGALKQIQERDQPNP